MTIVGLALILRIIAANTDLWLDEVWTLNLLKPITRPDEIFWKINHDNNHFLNSLWMYAVGPYRPSLLYRAPAVLCGVFTVIAAGKWGLRYGRFCAIAAMLLFATSYLTVDLSSQARGYSGMILCIVLAMICSEDAINDAPKPLRLGLIILAGTLSHVLMLFSAAALALWVFLIKVNHLKNALQTHEFMFKLFLPSAFMVMPIALWIGVLIDRHKFTIGGIEPFTLLDFFHTYGQAIQFSLSGLSIDWLCGIAVIGVSIAYFKIMRSDRSVLYMILIIALPVMMLEANLPNIKMARYFVPCAIAAIMLCAEVTGRLWNRPGVFPKVLAMVIVAFFATGNALSVYHFLQSGRGHYQDALNYVAQAGPASYSGNYNLMGPMVELYYTEQLHLPLTYVPLASWCAHPTDWLILHFASGQTPPPTLTYGPAKCAGNFDKPQIFSPSGPSAIGWAIYQRTL